MRQKLKLILIALASSLIFNQAYAQEGILPWLGGWAFGGLIWMLNGIFYIIGMIGAALFALGAALVQLALVLNAEIAQSQVVLIGWRITRDIANLGFVVGILVIAFSIMLRIENYATKKTLAKLVAAALLVNFSLALATPILDASHLFANFFITKAAGPVPTTFGDVFSKAKLDGFINNFSAAFQPQGLLEIKDGIKAFEGTATEAGNQFIKAVLSYFFLATFTFLAADTVLALAIMMFYRYVVLSILLIILPLAILMWVFPGLQGHWREWWRKFIDQTLFLPISLFFVYLAIVMVSQKASLRPFQAIQETQAGQAFGGFAEMMETPFATLGQMLTVLGLLMGGLFVAKKMGAVGAEASIGFATGLRNFVLGAGGRVIGKSLGLGKLGETRLGQALKRAQEEIAKTQAVGARIGRPISAVRAGFLGGEVKKGIAGDKNDKKLDHASLIKRYNSLSSADRLKLVNDNKVIKDPLQAGALLASIGQNGELDSLDTADFNALKDIAKANGDRTILKYMPHLADEFGTSIKDVIGGLRPEEFDKISHKSLANVDVISQLTEAEIDRFGRSGTGKQKEEIVNTLNDNFNQFDKQKLIAFGKVMKANSLRWAGVSKIRDLSTKINQIQPPAPPAPTVVAVGPKSGGAVQPQVVIPKDQPSVIIPPEATATVPKIQIPTDQPSVIITNQPTPKTTPAASAIDPKILEKIKDKEFIIGKIRDNIVGLERSRATQPEPIWSKLKSDQEENLSRALSDLQKLKEDLPQTVKFEGPQAPQVAAVAPPKVVDQGPTTLKLPEPGGGEIKKAA